MSAQGIAEFERLYRAGPHAALPWIPDVYVTDDAAPERVPGGTGAVIAGLRPDGRVAFALTPDLIPGEALVWHESGHVVQTLVHARLEATYDRTAVGALDNLVTEFAFAARGLVMKPVEPLYEQVASMLPEAFIGLWGGYVHPHYGLDPTSVRIASRTYFESSASERMRAFFRGLETWLPTPEQVEAATPRPTWTPPAVPPAPAPAPPASVVDLRARLLRADFSYGKRGPNTSITLHWNGGAIAADADPVAVLEADARFHVETRGWDGISYHRAYWRDGTCFITRDWDDTLAASGDGMGNADSSHWQLMIGRNDDGSIIQSPTPEMLAALTRDIRAELAAAPLEVYPHRYWSSTSCPGDELAAWVDRRGWVLGEEEDMDRATFDAWFREQQVAEIAPTIVAMKSAYDPLVATARANGELDAAQDLALTELQARIDKLKTI